MKKTKPIRKLRKFSEREGERQESAPQLPNCNSNSQNKKKYFFSFTFTHTLSLTLFSLSEEKILQSAR